MLTRHMRAGITPPVIVALLTTSCAGMMDQSGQAALACGAGGALVGAAAGAAVKNGDPAAILIGAASGALLGATTCFLIAEYKNRQVKDYQETKRTMNYRSSQGDTIQITHYSLKPAAAVPGSQMVFSATYYVMTPNPDQEVTVTETRIIQMFDRRTNQYRELGRTPSQVTVKPGTRQADGKFDVRPGVAEGRYRVIFQIENNGQNDTKELDFQVTRNPRILGADSHRTAEVFAAGGKAVQPAVGGSRPTHKLRYFLASNVPVSGGNLRELPSKQSKPVGTIKRGDRYPIVDQVSLPGEQTPWYKLRLENGIEAWVVGSVGVEVTE
ncbi:MAG: SH3 domain-containing protein [Candidatus Methylomirabilis oxyfera]|nr:SH3 domain-containing protein [Candidatus Methylomirabilis oxyfera]